MTRVPTFPLAGENDTIDGVSMTVNVCFDVAWPMKLLYVGWLAGLAAAPTGLARELAAFLLPERREKVNPFLRTLHRRNRVGRGAERVSR